MKNCRQVFKPKASSCITGSTSLEKQYLSEGKIFLFFLMIFSIFEQQLTNEK